MKDQLKEHGLNLAQILLLCAVLIIPSKIGRSIIIENQLYQVNQNIGFFIVIFTPLILYFFSLIYFNEKLISRLHDLVSLKYLVIIIVIFWIFYDLYMVSIYQNIYFEFQGLIKTRGIVWRDVEVLPLDVQYQDFLVAFYLANALLRAAVLVTICFKLIKPKEDYKKPTKVRKSRFQRKSLEELKTTLHPSIFKNRGEKDEN